MKPLARWRIGVFVVCGLAVLLAAAAWALRDAAPRSREAAVVRFPYSVYGLQAGAPVVLRGVQLGQVSEIGLAPPDASGLRVPVRLTLDTARLHELLGDAAGAEAPVPALVARGLVARLATQSLLTGQMYIDLDLLPGTTAAPGLATDEIPAATGALQDFQAQLAAVDLPRLTRELTDTAQAARLWLADPQWQQSLSDARTAAAALQSMAEAWKAQAAPVGTGATEALADSRRTMAALQQAAVSIEAAARDIGQAARQVETGSRDVGQAAQAVQGLAADDSSLRLQTEQTLQDLSRAARTLRELAETIDRQPDLLLRGRSAPNPP